MDRAQLGQGAVLLGARSLRVQRGGAQARTVEAGELVFHQRDQGRDHQHDPGQERGREGVGQRLAPARGEEDEHVAPGQRPLDGLALAWAEGREAEALREARPQRVLERLGRGDLRR